MKTGPRIGAVALLIAVFTAGATLGNTISNAWGNDDDDDGRRRGGSYSEMLARELGLTEQQRDSVVAILETSRPEMCAIWADFRPRYDSLRADIRSRIGEVLTSEQRETHETLSARHDSVRAARRSAADSTGRRNGCQ